MKTKRRMKCLRVSGRWLIMLLCLLCLGNVETAAVERNHEIRTESEKQKSKSQKPETQKPETRDPEETQWSEAQPQEAQAPEAIEIISEAFLAPYRQEHRPPTVYEQDHLTYQLAGNELIKAVIPEKEQYGETTETYVAVEQADQLPETIVTEIEDASTGVKTEAELPIDQVEFTNWRWISGFQLPITVQQYDAGEFYLGDQIVSAGEEDPFVRYGKELLALAGLSSQYYKIQKTRWDGEAWLSEDGYWYRNAVAEGEKYVADCQITYGGTVTLPETDGFAWKSIYKKSVEPETARELDTEAALQADPAESLWKKYIRQILKITIALVPILLFLILLWWLIHRKTCKKRHSPVH